jgi:site-specific DNA-cytosine methylase
MRKSSDITVIDQFCGAGGSSQGAQSAGARVVLAMNHWQLAVETHNTNFPDVLHDCVDISACDPRRYPRTNILITSPECTNHSPAKGLKRKQQAQLHLWEIPTIDPAAERSRATMLDVPRFAEYHQYECIIVENVVEARDWILFDEWLLMMQKLGYAWETVYFNSMFAHPTPQSRDRSKVPQLSDLRESGAIENDADVVLFIYRDELYNPEGVDSKNTADIIIAKHRNGPTGEVRLGFEASQTRFYDIEYSPSAEE